MKWIIWSIRSAFCKHEWEFDETHKRVFWEGHMGDEDYLTRTGTMVSATCNKC